MDDDGIVTLPPETLARLGWQPGQPLRIRAMEDGILIEPCPPPPMDSTPGNQG
ncbi:AbrB/MazE/SpoVT family DNA-binding domain-containing protein [uncultured Sphingomonas sp.]|uniref:AbrB/MazE/SpoVT family DNA-binding domain-containing protein n=1 Tax=Sphingomonas sp. TaxID=28214 RepID=UPI0026119B51|nr:AbrB/MazE/SpoVT family DNA-binding domain-containing protein [uncultured Sphingomonas sp.]